MQQIVYDIIDRCIHNGPNNNNEVNSIHSDLTVTPPLSTKNGSNNSCKDSQKDIKHIKKQIFFIDYYNNNKKININTNKKEKKFLEKKRKRFFLIKKVQKNKKETVLKKIPKINKIIFKHFKLGKFEENKNLDNNANNNTKSKKYFINILVNKDKNNINFKQVDNINNNNNNIKILKNDNIKNSNKNINNNEKNNITNKKEEHKEEEKEKENQINKATKEIHRRKKKKSSYATEKELQIAYEKKFLENINKNYSDKEYEEDIKQCLKDKKKKFMKDNFPIMFQKDKFYLYSILPKKRLSSKEYYIEPEFFNKNKNRTNFETYFNNYELNSIKEAKDVNYSDKKIFKIFKTKKLNKNNNLLFDKNNNKLINNFNDNIQKDGYNLEKEKEKVVLEPRKVWSLKKEKEINIDEFFEECTQIWPFDECCFIKEIALEFLMQSNYSIKYCLENLNEFIFFMKKRAKELDFPIISESVKTIKKYHLRKTNFN